MPTPTKYRAQFEENQYYHVYNHAVVGNLLFITDENYAYFLKRLDEYLSEWIEMDAWCLMNNHFHLLIRVKTVAELSVDTQKELARFATLDRCIINQFKRFFTAYTLAFNKMHKRDGGLWEHGFNRIGVNDETYYTRLIYYIHANPRHHGAMYDFQYYVWSSYGRMLNPNPTKLRKEQVLNWFGGRQKYIDFHADDTHSFTDMRDYLIDN